MTPIVKQDVLDFASELSTVTDAVWTKVLAHVNQINLTSDDSDEDRVLARIYLAAHIARVVKFANSEENNVSGPVTSESVGGIRRTYANITSATTQSALKTTPYGQLYLDLLMGTFCNGPQLGG
jgi:hypothetical protein